MLLIFTYLFFTLLTFTYLSYSEAIGFAIRVAMATPFSLSFNKPLSIQQL